MTSKQKKIRHREVARESIAKIRNRAKLLKMVDDRARLLWPDLVESLN